MLINRPKERYKMLHKEPNSMLQKTNWRTKPSNAEGVWHLGHSKIITRLTGCQGPQTPLVATPLRAGSWTWDTKKQHQKPTRRSPRLSAVGRASRLAARGSRVVGEPSRMLSSQVWLKPESRSYCLRQVLLQLQDLVSLRAGLQGTNASSPSLANRDPLKTHQLSLSTERNSQERLSGELDHFQKQSDYTFPEKRPQEKPLPVNSE